MASPELPWGPAPGEVFSVGDLLVRARSLLEGAFGCVWVEGEISNTRVPASGHAYFSLGDDRAQVRAVCFRNTLRVLRLTPTDGLRVLVRGRLTLYEARGDVQLIVEDWEPLGDGAQRLELEARKRRLRDEGLFDAARKRPLPELPRWIGVVTSLTGAALHDILNVLGRRAPGVSVAVSPTRVQGPEAAREIVDALSLAAAHPGVEVVILGRGGGSAEDLSAFNEEAVVRAVARCPVPVVSAVGHDVDVPLVDFAADARAPTPSAAAELAVREWGQWSERLRRSTRELHGALATRLLRLHRRVDDVQRRLPSPGARIDRRRLRLDQALERQGAALQARFRRVRAGVCALEQRLAGLCPRGALAAGRGRLDQADVRLEGAWQRAVTQRRDRLKRLEGLLNALDPRSVLARGYALARGADGSVLRDAALCAPGQEIDVVLARGSLACVVSSATAFDGPKG